MSSLNSVGSSGVLFNVSAFKRIIVGERPDEEVARLAALITPPQATTIKIRDFKVKVKMDTDGDEEIEGVFNRSVSRTDAYSARTVPSAASRPLTSIDGMRSRGGYGTPPARETGEKGKRSSDLYSTASSSDESSSEEGKNTKRQRKS